MFADLVEKPTGSAARDEEPSFEEILTRLTEIVERLEKGDLPLEESLHVFEQGVELTRLGQRRLDEAETRVEQLLSDDGSETRPLGDAKEPE